MKLSVVIPVFNGARFIQKSYNEILKQGLVDFEMLYIDNNSEDNSVDEINRLNAKDKRVKLFIENKPGAAAARNKGIYNAIGKYIYLFDVDDEIYPKALISMIQILETNKHVDAVFGKMVKSYQSIAETEKPKDESFKVIFKEQYYWGLKWFSDLRTVVGPPAFLYRSNIFKKIGVYNENLKLGEDTALDIKLGMLCNVAFYDAYVYLYFKHQKSTTQIAKKNENMIFHTWARLVKEHLPFSLNYRLPNAFNTQLSSQLLSMMGKVIFYTTGFSNRILKIKEIQVEIKPIELPWQLKLYFYILAYCPYKPILKYYVYYFSKSYVSNLLKMHYHNTPT